MSSGKSSRRRPANKAVDNWHCHQATTKADHCKRWQWWQKLAAEVDSRGQRATTSMTAARMLTAGEVETDGRHWWKTSVQGTPRPPPWPLLLTSSLTPAYSISLGAMMPMHFSQGWTLTLSCEGKGGGCSNEDSSNGVAWAVNNHSKRRERAADCTTREGGARRRCIFGMQQPTN